MINTMVTVVLTADSESEYQRAVVLAEHPDNSIYEIVERDEVNRTVRLQMVQEN